MPSCALTAGYANDCRTGMGGVKEVYLMELANLSAAPTEVLGVITVLPKATGKRFWKFAQVKETSYGKSTLSGNTQNGTVVYNQEVGIVLNKMSTSTRNQIILLAQNILVAVVKDNNGVYWLYGKVNGLDLNGGESGTGTAMGDRNGYTLTLTGMEVAPEVEVLTAVGDALETPGA